MHRAIGGSCAEYIHIDEEVHQIATLWSSRASVKAHRTCPFCKNGTGILRLHVMCSETKQYTEAIGEAIEADLGRLCDREQMIEKLKSLKVKTHKY